ncbi:unnamed protein product [Bursaphelenchus xylophilus]|uniref:(pine wood nematode) hypothetical protein n=1 Tax=Bursaphelenchus xylophilus TaxID=6326 RepID=A0A1I7RIY4_BURXY|nr:unnamed protein product [Bursaphelenchus xylophilus]CAG9119175.1 unnamed protein product [Bursaphelenchus xylophilus]
MLEVEAGPSIKRARLDDNRRKQQCLKDGCKMEFVSFYTTRKDHERIMRIGMVSSRYIKLTRHQYTTEHAGIASHPDDAGLYCRWRDLSVPILSLAKLKLFLSVSLDRNVQLFEVMFCTPTEVLATPKMVANLASFLARKYPNAAFSVHLQDRRIPGWYLYPFLTHLPKIAEISCFYRDIPYLPRIKLKQLTIGHNCGCYESLYIAPVFSVPAEEMFLDFLRLDQFYENIFPVQPALIRMQSKINLLAPLCADFYQDIFENLQQGLPNLRTISSSQILRSNDLISDKGTINEVPFQHLEQISEHSHVKLAITIHLLLSSTCAKHFILLLRARLNSFTVVKDNFHGAWYRSLVKNKTRVNFVITAARMVGEFVNIVPNQ